MNVPQDQHDGEQLGVVVGVDGTRIALDAVRWAGTEARLRGLPLQILHAAPYAAGSTFGLRRARDILARAYTVAHRADLGIPVATFRTERAAAPALLAAARRARLLVVGMGGGDRPQEVLIGSVALDVSAYATCPVAVVRGHHRRPADAPVLVGVGDAATDAAVLSVAFADAHRHGSPIVVLHARHGPAPFGAPGFGAPPHGEAARLAARAELADALTPLTTRFPDVPVELTVVLGPPTPALLAAAVHARVVVAGTRGRSAPARALLGSVSRAVLRRSPVPVVAVSRDAGNPDTGPSDTGLTDTALTDPGPADAPPVATVPAPPVPNAGVDDQNDRTRRR